MFDQTRLAGLGIGQVRPKPTDLGSIATISPGLELVWPMGKIAAQALGA